MTSTSKCLCGQISVSVPKEALDGSGMTAVCYCTNCRRATGSVGSLNLILPESAVQITGQPKIYKDSDTDSGVTIQRAFCGNCGSSIYGLSPNRSGMLVVRLGLFDAIPKPSMEIYCKDRPSWIKPIDDANQFDAMPTK